jgi:hypothetical protein
MSLSVIARGPEGLVFAAESRSLADFTLPDGRTIPINFDGTNKILTFNKPHNFVAAVTYGLGLIGDRSVYSFMPEIEAAITEESRLSVKEYANKLSSFFMQEWDKRPPAMKDYKGDPIVFVMGGFDEGELLSHTYEIQIPSKPEPVELPQTGVTWGGMREIAYRLVCGYDENLPKLLTDALLLTEEQVKSMKEIVKQVAIGFPLANVGLQGYVDIAKLLISTTIETQRLTACLRGCGGPIDIVAITRRDGLRYVQHKA